jgi:hypothetical protein
VLGQVSGVEQNMSTLGSTVPHSTEVEHQYMQLYKIVVFIYERMNHGKKKELWFRVVTLAPQVKVFIV